MKEPQDTHVVGSTSDSATHTTAKLPHGTTRPLQSTPGSADAQEQAQVPTNNDLQLVVVEGIQIGR